MKFISTLTGCFLFIIASSNAQTFDYASFKDGQPSQLITLGNAFHIENFDACWDLEFRYEVGTNKRTKKLIGKQLSDLFLIQEPLTISISDNRQTLSSKYFHYDDEVPRVGDVAFKPLPVTTLECATRNTKLTEGKKQIVPEVKLSEEILSIPSERNPLFDAVLLKQMLDKKEYLKIKALLSLYGIDSLNIGSKTILNTNGYGLKFFPAAGVSQTVVIAEKSSASTEIQGAGGVSFVSNLTEALAQFIAKRAKQELTLAYLNRFRDFLQVQNTRTKLGILLPESFRVLTQAEPYDYTTFWQAMHEGFQDDVALFPENTMSFVRASEPKFKDKDLFSATVVGLYTLRGVFRQYSAVNVIDSLELVPEIKGFKTSNVGATIRTLSLLSRNLHHLKEISGQYQVDGWIKPNELVALSDIQTKDFFAGLLLAKEGELMKEIVFNNGGAVSVTLEKIFTATYKTDEFRKQLDGLLRQLEMISKSEKDVVKYISNMTEDKDKTRTTFERYETYANQLLTLMDFSTGIVNTMNLGNPKIIGISKTVSRFSSIGHTGIDLTKHLHEKRYNLAFFDVVKLLKDLNADYFGIKLDTTKLLSNSERSSLENLNVSINDWHKIDSQELFLLTSSANSATEKSAVKKLTLSFDEKFSKDSISFWSDVIKYGTFITNVAGADSASQIVAALETAALPVGSYRIKHENHFSVSLNAFGGLSGSHEYLSRVRSTEAGQPNPTPKNGFVLNPTAPIGLHFGWGRKGKIFETAGVFVPVIDIGAAFALRFRGDVKALPDKLEWDNILAPGLYFVTGFRNSPLALSVGAQYGAGLRKLEYDTNASTTSFSAQSVWIGATLSVDIPLFNLHVSKGR